MQTVSSNEIDSIMVQRQLTVRFNTPAFLGNAEQNGRWRTPPFKHLLREWWRVAWAEANGYAASRWQRMREIEGKLFGHAWLENDMDNKGNPVPARKSAVRIRLVPWSAGKLQTLPRTQPVAARAPASALYLGYGPVKSADKLNMEHPLDASEPDGRSADHAQLTIVYPENIEGSDLIPRALELMQWYGCIGGRSRNGWGSLFFEGDWPELSTVPARPWKEALGEQWAHAIGDDGRVLVWTSVAAHPKWQNVIDELGKIRKEVNALFKGRQREVLNQPVGGRGKRVPSNLRFKIRRDDKGLRAVVFHMPFLPPGVDEGQSGKVWGRVHHYLDSKSSIRRASW